MTRLKIRRSLVLNRSTALVALFVNTVAFNDRCIPPRYVARRSHTLDMLASRALRGGRLCHLGASPYLRTGPLSHVKFFSYNSPLDPTTPPSDDIVLFH